jgi:hypothetical protein
MMIVWWEPSGARATPHGLDLRHFFILGVKAAGRQNGGESRKGYSPAEPFPFPSFVAREGGESPGAHGLLPQDGRARPTFGCLGWPSSLRLA